MLSNFNTDEKNLELPETKENIIDVTIEGVKKQKFRINGGAILELDVTDLNIVPRLRKVYPKLAKLANEATSKVDIDSEVTVDEQLETLADVLEEIDKQMREYVDYIFNSNVCEICSPNTSMYAPHGGKFTYEHITETLGGLYANGLDEEAKRMSHRLKQHTDKYINRKRK